MSRFIGFTTVIPIEILFAAGYVPVDLNNSFISSTDCGYLVDFAEQQGFPRNCCSWIKGIYSTTLRAGLEIVIGVMSGDCNQSQILCHVLEEKGVRIIPFFYPYDQDKAFLFEQFELLQSRLGTSWENTLKIKALLDRIREKAALIDEYTWDKDLVHGMENHSFLLSCSDMKGDPEAFENQIDNFLSQLKYRQPMKEDVRLGFIGVPPIFTDIYDFCESVGGRVVFNEVQRQFSMPYKCKDIKDQYTRFTYPYGLSGRLADIRQESEKRRLDGLIHYCQSFCFRNMEDLVFRHNINIPVLYIEGDYPGIMDARTKIRIESFIEMLREQKGVKVKG